MPSSDGKGADEPFHPAELAPLVALAKEGDKAAILRLRDIFDNHPEVWKAAGNLAKISEHALIERISGKDRALIGAMRRFIDSMKTELAGSVCTPLEQ